MKKVFIYLFLGFILCGCSVNSAPVNISYDDGIYHIVVDKSKIRKKIKKKLAL